MSKKTILSSLNSGILTLSSMDNQNLKSYGVVVELSSKSCYLLIFLMAQVETCHGTSLQCLFVAFFFQIGITYRIVGRGCLFEKLGSHLEARKSGVYFVFPYTLSRH